MHENPSEMQTKLRLPDRLFGSASSLEDRQSREPSGKSSEVRTIRRPSDESSTNAASRGSRPILMILCSLLLSLTTGCVSLNGIPPTRVPRDILARPRDGMLHTSLARLRQNKPSQYQLGPGDTLGVFIDNILGDENQPVPYNESKNDERPPSSGYPVTIETNGTIQLPLTSPIPLQGLTLQEATEKIRKVLVTTQQLAEGGGKGRFLVTLMRPRTQTVLVVRQEATLLGNGRNVTRTTDTQVPGKKGTGYILELPAYENDVLHALNQTGGLPGDDAKNEIVIYRGEFGDAEQRDTILAAINAGLDPCTPKPCDPLDKTVTRIPLTYYPDNPPKFTEEDIVLRDGDIVMIEARETEVFYTGGVLMGQEIALPRDYDLDIVGAIALAGGQIGGAGTGVGNLGRGGQLNQIRSTNIGVPPSICYVIRKTPGGGQIPIRVNLKKTLVDPNERILIQPGDLVMVQYSFSEELANAFLGVFSLNYVGNFQGFHEF